MNKDWSSWTNVNWLKLRNLGCGCAGHIFLTCDAWRLRTLLTSGEDKYNAQLRIANAPTIWTHMSLCAPRGKELLQDSWLVETIAPINKTSRNGRASRCHHCSALQRSRRRWAAVTAETSVGVPQRRLGVTGFDWLIYLWPLLDWKCQIFVQLVGVPDGVGVLGGAWGSNMIPIDTSTFYSTLLYTIGLCCTVWPEYTTWLTAHRAVRIGRPSRSIYETMTVAWYAYMAYPLPALTNAIKVVEFEAGQTNYPSTVNISSFLDV